MDDTQSWQVSYFVDKNVISQSNQKRGIGRFSYSNLYYLCVEV